MEVVTPNRTNSQGEVKSTLGREDNVVKAQKQKKNKTKQNYVMFQEKESNQGAWSLGSRGKTEENKKLVGQLMLPG